MQRRLVILGMAVLLVGLCLPHAALAATGGKMPLANFFKDLFEEMGATYIPVLCLGALFFFCGNYAFGWVSIGEGLGRVLIVISLLGLGVSGVSNMVGGGNIAASAELPPPGIVYTRAPDRPLILLDAAP